MLRDLDLLKQAADLRLASVALSVTSLDPKVARTLEPRAPQPRKRLAAIKALNDAGVPCYVAIAPVVPQITDHELEHIVEAAVEAGAPGGFYLPVRLPHEVAPLFRAWLDEHYPDRAAKVMATIRSLRGGRDNDPNFFSRMRGQGSVGRPAPHPVRDRLQEIWPAPGQVRAADRPVPAARRRPDAPSLIDERANLIDRRAVTSRLSLPSRDGMKPYLLAAFLLHRRPRLGSAVDHHAAAAGPCRSEGRGAARQCARRTTIMPGTSSKA